MMKRMKTIESWHTLLQNSTTLPFLLFKYSMTCFSSISANKELRALETDLPIYTVIVQTDCKASNIIKQDLQVKHASPQLLIIKNGKAIWQATHYHVKKKIVYDAISTYL